MNSNLCLSFRETVPLNKISGSLLNFQMSRKPMDIYLEVDITILHLVGYTFWQFLPNHRLIFIGNFLKQIKNIERKKCMPKLTFSNLPDLYDVYVCRLHGKQ